MHQPGSRAKAPGAGDQRPFRMRRNLSSRKSSEGRLSGVVDIPNSCSTVYLPTEIFDIDIRPSASGPTKIDPGMGVSVSKG